MQIYKGKRYIIFNEHQYFVHDLWIAHDWESFNDINDITVTAAIVWGSSILSW